MTTPPDDEDARTKARHSQNYQILKALFAERRRSMTQDEFVEWFLASFNRDEIVDRLKYLTRKTGKRSSATWRRLESLRFSLLNPTALTHLTQLSSATLPYAVFLL